MTELLERDDELVRLDGLLDSAVAGRGRVVFVGGEPGIGKTSLAARFGELSAAKADVLWGRCDALATPRAMGPLLDVAAALGWTGGGRHATPFSDGCSSACGLVGRASW